jgi:hypothetical protein
MGARRRQRYLALATGAVVLVALGGVLVVVLGQSKGQPQAKSRPLSSEERGAEKLERRLARSPGNHRLQLAAMEAWVEAGAQRLFHRNVESERIPVGVRQDFEAGMRIWDRYLEQVGGKADIDTAEIASSISLELAEIGSRDPADLEADVARAARAVQIAGRHRPTLFTLSNVAVYSYFNGEYARGDVAAKGAAETFMAKRRQDIVYEQLDSSREWAKVFRRLLAHANAELEESGDELLEEPLKAYTSEAGINKDEPTAGGGR